MSPSHTCGVFIGLSVDRCGKSSTEQAALFFFCAPSQDFVAATDCWTWKALWVEWRHLRWTDVSLYTPLLKALRKPHRTGLVNRNLCGGDAMNTSRIYLKLFWNHLKRSPVADSDEQKDLVRVAQWRLVEGEGGGEAPLLGGDRGSCPDFFALLCRPLISHKGPQWQLAHSDHTWIQGAWQTRWEWHTRAGREAIRALTARLWQCNNKNKIK